MDNWQWTEGGCLKDNNKEQVVNSLIADGGIIFRKSPNNMENAYQFLYVINDNDLLYAIKGYIELNEWLGDDAITYPAAEYHETPEEFIKNHTGQALESMFTSHSVWSVCDVENQFGDGTYSIKYEDFKITPVEFYDWLERLDVFKDNRELKDMGFSHENVFITKSTHSSAITEVDFFTDEEYTKYLLDKMNEEYGLDASPEDVKQFEYIDFKNGREAFVQARLNKPYALNGQMYDGFDFSLSKEDLKIIKEAISTNLKAMEMKQNIEKE